MNIIEQLRFEQHRLRQGPYHEVSLESQRMLEDAIKKIKNEGKQNILQEEAFYLEQGTTNTDSLYDQLYKRICMRLEQDDGSKTFPHWITLLGEVVTQLEDELDTTILLLPATGLNPNFLLFDMVDQGEISMLEDGTIRRNPYRLLKKVENYQSKVIQKK